MISIIGTLRDPVLRRGLFLSLLVAVLTACGVGAVNDAAEPTSANAPVGTSTGATTGGSTGATGHTTGGTSGTTTGATTGTTTGTTGGTTTPNPNASPTTSPNTPSGGPGAFTGTVQQASLNVASASFAIVTGSGGQQTLAVKLSDQSDDCSEVTNNAHHSNSNSFWLRAVGDTFAGASFQLAGKSTDSGQSTATFYALDNTCASTLSDDASWATAGTVSFTQVTAQSATGTFKATIGSQGDQVSGSFTATLCPALATLITTPGTTRTCQ